MDEKVQKLQQVVEAMDKKVQQLQQVVEAMDKKVQQLQQSMDEKVQQQLVENWFLED